MKATTLDEALINTLRVRRRLDIHKLVFFTQLRAQRDLKLAPSQRAVKAVLAKALKQRLVVRVDDRYELGAGETRKANATKARAAQKRAQRPPPPRERCYFPSIHADAFERAATAVTKRFEVFATKPDAVSFRWRHTPTSAGPDFRLERAERDEVVRVMRVWQKRKLRTHEPPFVTFLVIAFADLAEVLDEINGLIEAQHVVSKATGGPMFNAWNKTLMSAAGEQVTYGSPL
jgi:hypothetical protein